MNREELLKIAKPILFNTEMVQAIIDNRKTVTRRIVKYYNRTPITNGKDKFYKIDENLNGNNPNRLYAGFYNDNDIFYIDDEKHIDGLYYPLYFKVGDILYVRETWQYVYNVDDSTDQCIEDTGRYIYYADGDMPFSYWVDSDTGEHKEKMPWKPSIHMPKSAARIFLRVTDVKVERLQDITEEQAKMEGAKKSPFKNPTMRFADKEIQKENMSEFTYINGFREIWFDTLPRYYTGDIAWEGNPWVWVIGFERVLSDEYN